MVQVLFMKFAGTSLKKRIDSRNRGVTYISYRLREINSKAGMRIVNSNFASLSTLLQISLLPKFKKKKQPSELMGPGTQVELMEESSVQLSALLQQRRSSISSYQ